MYNYYSKLLQIFNNLRKYFIQIDNNYFIHLKLHYKLRIMTKNTNSITSKPYQ